MKKKITIGLFSMILTVLSLSNLNAVECTSTCDGYNCKLKRDCDGTCTEYSDRIKCDLQVWYCSIECETTVE